MLLWECVYADELSGRANPLLPVQSWYSPRNRDGTVLCTDAAAGAIRARGRSRGGPCSSHSRLNASHQPIAAWMHWLYGIHYMHPAPHTTISIRYPSQGEGVGWGGGAAWLGWTESGMIMSNEWVMHQEWAAAGRNLRQHWAVGGKRGELFSKSCCHRNWSWPGPQKSKRESQSTERAPMGTCEVIHVNPAFQTERGSSFRSDKYLLFWFSASTGWKRKKKSWNNK